MILPQVACFMHYLDSLEAAFVLEYPEQIHHNGRGCSFGVQRELEGKVANYSGGKSIVIFVAAILSFSPQFAWGGDPTGACCAMNGSCSIATAEHCGHMAGLYQGDGTSCGFGICDGSCCHANGSCKVESAAACSMDGTFFRGPGTTCDEPCLVRQIVSSAPTHCTIDARIPFHPNQPANRLGFQSIEFTFDGPAGTTENNAGDYSVTQIPAATPPFPPFINNVALNGNKAMLSFNVPIQPGKWTCVRHNISGVRQCIGFLPGDVNSNLFSGPADILELVDDLNGVRIPALETHQCDIDRSNLCAPADILSEIDLLNGVNLFPLANGATLQECPSIQP